MFINNIIYYKTNAIPVQQQVKSNSLVRNRYRDECGEGRGLQLRTSSWIRDSQIQQVGTRVNNQVPSKTHTTLPNSDQQPTTSSEFKVTGAIQQKLQQKTILNTPPSTYSAHSNPVARPLTEISALLSTTHPKGSVQSGTPRQRYPLPPKSTFERSAVSETAPTSSGRPQTALYGVGPRSLITATQNPGNQTAVALDPSADSTAQQPNAVSSNRFYQPLPRLPRRPNRPTSVSSALGSHLSDSVKPTDSSRCKDDLLMLYRDPPVWSALNAAVTRKCSEEAASSQHREWQRMRPVNGMAVVDMNSAKATRLRQRLGEFIEREVTNKRQKVHNCEHEPNNQTRFLVPAPADPPIFVPVQPSQSRNPFKKHSVQIESNEIPMSRPRGHKQLSTVEATSAKPVIPISAIKIPVLPLDVRKAALALENVGSSGHTGANVSKKLKAKNGSLNPEMTKEAQRRGDHGTSRVTKPCRQRPSAGAAFDWKIWGKRPPC